MADDDNIVVEYIDEDFDAESDDEAAKKNEKESPTKGVQDAGGEAKKEETNKAGGDGAGKNAASTFGDSGKADEKGAGAVDAPAAEPPAAAEKPSEAEAPASAPPPEPAVEPKAPPAAAKQEEGKETEASSSSSSSSAPAAAAPSDAVAGSIAEKPTDAAAQDNDEDAVPSSNEPKTEALPLPKVPGKSPPRSPRQLEVQKGGGHAAGSSSAKLKVFLKDAFVGDLGVSEGDAWEAVLAKLKTLDPLACGFEYDRDGKEGVACKESAEWEAASKALATSRGKLLDVAMVLASEAAKTVAPEPPKEEEKNAPAPVPASLPPPAAPPAAPAAAAALKVDKNASVPQPPATAPPAKTESAVPAVQPGGGLSKAQRIFRDKVLRPRRPGVMDVLRAFGAMPASVCLSPLPKSRAHNLENLWGGWAKGSKGVVAVSVQIAAANNIPGVGDMYEVVSRRARACICSKTSRSFLCPPHTVLLSRKNEGKVEWVFSQKDSCNPFTMRANHGAGEEVGLYIEMSCAVRRKGSTTTGAKALACGDIKQVSCGHAYVALTAQPPAPGKQNLPVQGGTPWAPVPISASDIPKSSGGGLMGAFKKQDKNPHIEVSWTASTLGPADNFLPRNMVFPSGVMETLSLFSLIASSKAPSDDPFSRVIRYDPLVASFPRLTTDAVLLAKLAESWGEATKKLGKQAEHAKRVEAFRECAIALMQVASLAPDVMPMPGESFDEAKKEKRAKAIDAFCKEPDLSKVMSGSLGHKFLPFHICNDVPGLQ